MFGVLKGEKFLLMLKAGLISDISSSGTAGGGHVARLLHRLPLRHQAQRRGGPGSGGPRDVQGQRGHRDHRGLPDSRGVEAETGGGGGGESETGGSGWQSLAGLPLPLSLAGHGTANILQWSRQEQEELQTQRPVRRVAHQLDSLEVLHLSPHWISPGVSGAQGTWDRPWSSMGRLCTMTVFWCYQLSYEQWKREQKIKKSMTRYLFPLWRLTSYVGLYLSMEVSV